MILCCGEALIDMLPRRTVADEAARAAGGDMPGPGRTPAGEPCFAPHAGGAVFNTAIALGRLGAPAGFLSGLSSDFFGDMLRRRLAESGVDASLCVTAARPTTLAFVRLVEGQASYAFYDENSAGRMLSPADLPALPAAVRALFFGGISLVAEPAARTYAGLIAGEGERRLTMLDPNIRPSFIADEGRYRRRLEGMLARTDLLKLSDEDLHWLEGPGEVAALVEGLRRRGPRVVFLTRGAAGASAYAGGAPVEVAAPRVRVADTVGAGDTFNAGVLAALAREGALEKAAAGRLGADLLARALALGVRAAAVTVSRPGADPPWADQL